MTMKDDLASLIDRVEAAEGPDRELDAAIWLLVTPGATRRESRFMHRASGKEQVIDETREANGRLIVVLAYTASIDAAMTLVPDLGEIDGRRFDLYNFEKHATARVYSDEDTDRKATAATPALALVAACLRARQGEDHHGRD